MNQGDLQRIMQRLERLEAAVFGNSAAPKKGVLVDSKGYSGLPGGIRLLVDEGFFDSPQALNPVRNALASRGYHYSRQAVHNSLARLVKQTGPLVALKKGPVKTYAKRK